MLAIGCDHGGYELKQDIVKHLQAQKLAVKDYGCFSTDSVDYPDYAYPVARAVADGTCALGILICGTGIGMAMAAGKVAGIRCAVCGDTFSAHATREHNDANILALGARVIGKGLACDIVDAFLAAEFQGGRHAARIAKITKIEEEALGGGQ